MFLADNKRGRGECSTIFKKMLASVVMRHLGQTFFRGSLNISFDSRVEAGNSRFLFSALLHRPSPLKHLNLKHREETRFDARQFDSHKTTRRREEADTLVKSSAYYVSTCEEAGFVARGDPILLPFAFTSF